MVNKSKERAIRLIEYLTALAKINSKIIRSIEEYRSVLWMHEIPHEPKHCFCRVLPTPPFFTFLNRFVLFSFSY